MEYILEQLYISVEESLPYRPEDHALTVRLADLEKQLLGLLPEAGRALAEEYTALALRSETHSRENLFLRALALGLRLGGLAAPAL